MNIYPYSISPKIKVNLGRIRILRQRVLGEIISRSEETQLKWNAKVSNIYYFAKECNLDFGRREIANFLRENEYKGAPTPQNTLLINYKNALEYINNYWYITPALVNLEVVLFLHKLSALGFSKKSAKFGGRGAEVKLLLDYLQAGAENPIIQAGIAQAQLKLINPFGSDSESAGRLLGRLFLYKYGYDFREMLVLDEYWVHELEDYKRALQSVSVNQNLTLWLEYYTNALSEQLEKVVATMRSPIATLGISSSYFQLNERQRKILSVLADPAEKVTNRQVQERYGVSQITASRDLSKMATLGVLKSAGKGRSVYYVKI